MSDTFCILPWIHMSLTPGGFGRLCCQTPELISNNQIPMSLYVSTIDEIWNSVYMRDVRRKMVAGQEVSACRVCYRMEDQLGGSNRVTSNDEWAEMIGPFDAMIQDTIKNKYKQLKAPTSFHLIPGTLCNLKCRMCTPLFSSQVQADPIHSQWYPPNQFLEPEVIQWREGKFAIGPQPIVGVDTSGFYEPEIHAQRILRWTMGDAILSFDVPQNLTLDKLKLKIWEHHPRSYSFARKLLLRLQRKNVKGHNLKVFINDHPLFRDEMKTGAWEKNFDLSGQHYSGPVSLRLLSDTFRVPLDSRRLGVAMESVEVTCEETGQTPPPKKLDGSVDSLPGNPWYEQTEWLFNILLKNPERLRELQLSGGEPMIQKQVEQIIDFCIDQKVAGNISLKFNINCTVLPERMLKKLSRFKKNFIALSIDGYGPYWEYIRYPGKWDNVNEHVLKLKQLPNAFVVMVPVLQIYNALNIVELLEYSDMMGLDCWIYPLTTPWFLSVSVLPSKARQVAARRLREFADSGRRPHMRDHILKMAEYVESVNDNSTTASLNTLMHFTNDLDATRNQSFQKTHGELLGMIEETGFRWSDEKRFF